MHTYVDSLDRSAHPAAARRSDRFMRGAAVGALTLFTMTTLTIPAALANKVLFGILLLLLLLAPLASRGAVRISTIAPLVILTVFCYGYALAFVNDTDRQLTNQFMLSVAVLLLIYLVQWYSINLEPIIKASGVVLCLFTGLSYYAVIGVPDSQLGSYFTDYFLEYSLLASGERGNLADDPLFMFRVGAAPFLFLPYCLFLISLLRTRRMRDVLALLLIVAVIVVSTSRGLILGCLLASLYLGLSRLPPVSRLVVLCIAAALSLVLVQFVATRTELFSLAEESNSVKVGHAISFVEHMTPARLVFGEGLAAYYFSIGRNEIVAHTEITLLDLTRYVGLPLAALVYAMLLFPSLRAAAYKGESRTHMVLLAIYLAISLTNPVLLNSFGLLVVLWYWSRILSAEQAAGHDAQLARVRAP